MERVLKNRKKRVSKGRILRVSDAVWAHLEPKRKDGESFDSLMRRIFGLPDRDGFENPLLKGWIEVTTGQFFITREDAYGAAVVAAAKAKSRRVNKPVRVREAI